MRRRASVALTVMCALAAVSCGSTKVISKWVDPQYTAGPIGRALVIGVSNDATERREFEDAFVARLTSKKASALASYQLVPDGGDITEEAVASIVQQRSVTHVLVTRIVSSETVETHVPATVSMSFQPFPYYGGWYSYYDFSYSTVVSPGYTYETEYVNLETNVYEVASTKLVWSGMTQSEIGSRAAAHIAELVSVLTHQMGQDKLL